MFDCASVDKHGGVPGPRAQRQAKALRDRVAVEDGRRALSQARFQNTGAELAGGLNPVDAFGFIRELSVFTPPRLAVKCASRASECS